MAVGRTAYWARDAKNLYSALFDHGFSSTSFAVVSAAAVVAVETGREVSRQALFLHNCDLRLTTGPLCFGLPLRQGAYSSKAARKGRLEDLVIGCTVLARDSKALHDVLIILVSFCMLLWR